MFSKAKIGLAGDFEAVFAKTFDDMITLIRKKIDEGKKAVAKIESDLEENAAMAKAKHEEELQKQFLAEQKFQAGVRGFRAPQIMPATGGGGPVRVWGRKLPIEP